MSHKKSMNNKVLTFVLLVGIASTSFAGISSANSGQTFSGKSNGIHQGEKKIFQGGNHFGKRKGLKSLSDDEKTALEAMSDTEKKAFFDAKHDEMKAEKEVGKLVIDKLINGESLTAAEEAIRGEMLIKIEEGKHRKNGADIIAKILAGDELTQAEQIDYIEMQEKRAQREVKKAVMQDIKAKLDAGEELTVEEQAALDEAKAHRPEGKRGGKGHRGGDRGER